MAVALGFAEISNGYKLEDAVESTSILNLKSLLKPGLIGCVTILTASHYYLLVIFGNNK